MAKINYYEKVELKKYFFWTFLKSQIVSYWNSLHIYYDIYFGKSTLERLILQNILLKLFSPVSKEKILMV